MEKKYYKFTSKGYLTTMAVVDIYTLEAWRTGDKSDDIRFLNENLMVGEYPDWLKFPLEYVEYWKGKAKDVLEMRRVCCFLISEHLKDVFEEAGLTGWKTFDVIVRKKDGEILPGYYGFSVTGRNPSSKVEEDVEIPDFFRLKPKLSIILCTQRVIDTLKANKIRDFDVYPIKGDDVFGKHYDLINFPKE